MTEPRPVPDDYSDYYENFTVMGEAPEEKHEPPADARRPAVRPGPVSRPPKAAE